MVLEATMICIDNSEYMRNEDYSPSRCLAQADAVNLICGMKTQDNPENTVGVLTMAGKAVRVLTTPTSDIGKILTCTHGLEIGGEMNIAGAIQVAQLALKHRQNKNQQQRIVVFAGSTVKNDKKALEIIGKKLKKNSVALDIVDFGGEDEEKSEKLDALVSAVDNGTSHIVHIPHGQNLSDVILSSPILTSNEGGAGFAAAAAGIGGSSGLEFGVDPNIDPELALALRMSMEEERARQEAAAARRAEEEAATQGKEEERQSKSEDVAMTERDDVEMVDEDALLVQALAMSMNNYGSDSSAVGDAAMSEATGVDEDLALALQMSIQESAKWASSSSSSSEAADVSKVLEDQSFISSILASLPGVDSNDPSVKEFFASLNNQSKEFLASLNNQSKKDEQDPSNDQKK